MVLVVDDNQATARSIATLLKAARFDAKVAYKGAEAIEFSREHACHAALVDIHLPDVSGLVVSQKLREFMGPRAPIVILSGDTSMSTLNSLPHVGATYFFSKPVNGSYLVERLREWMAEAGDEPAGQEEGADETPCPGS